MSNINNLAIRLEEINAGDYEDGVAFLKECQENDSIFRVIRRNRTTIKVRISEFAVGSTDVIIPTRVWDTFNTTKVDKVLAMLSSAAEPDYLYKAALTELARLENKPTHNVDYGIHIRGRY